VVSIENDFTILCYPLRMKLNARVMVVTALGLGLLGGAMAGVRLSSVGETRPMVAHSHNTWQGNLNASLPPVLPYIPTY
jgi:hypothetical protein